jgi:hypothetical protein
MYSFNNNNNSNFYHEQKFTLHWNFPEARRVIVRYFNGNKRVVLPIITNSKSQVVDGSGSKFFNFILTLVQPLKLGKTISRTEFNNKAGKKVQVENFSQEPLPAEFGFKRIFIKRTSDEFSNIANFRSQFVQLYLITSSFPWVKSVKIPMNVKLFRVAESKMNVRLETIQLTQQDFHVTQPDLKIALSDVSIENTDVEIQLTEISPKFDVQFEMPFLSESLNEIIASRKITEDNNNETILQLIN